TDGRYWKSVTFPLPDPAGVYALRNNEQFAAYGYGFESADSYGYPLSAALRAIDKPDIWTPTTTVEIDCEGNVEGYATEQPSSDSLRSNFAMLMVLDEKESYNYELSNPDSSDFVPGVTVAFEWFLKLKDKDADGHAVLSMIDRAGNDTTFIIDHIATKFRLTPKVNNYGLVAYNDPPKEKIITVTNSTERAVMIDSIMLFSDDASKKLQYQGFTLKEGLYESEGGLLPGHLMQPGEELQVTVIYDPSTVADQINSGITNFTDSIGVKADWSELDGYHCYYRYLVSVTTATGSPVITAEDHDFGQVTVETSNPPTKTLEVKNIGNAALTITGITGPVSVGPANEDIYTHNISPTFPIIIDAGSSVMVDVTFLPIEAMSYPDEIFFICDSDSTQTGHDPHMILDGVGLAPGIALTPYDWEERRIHLPAYDLAESKYGNSTFPYVTPTADLFKIINSGDRELTIDSVSVDGGTNTSYFTADFNGNGTRDTLETALKALLNQKIDSASTLTYPIYYDPKTVGEHEVRITIGGVIDGNHVYASTVFNGIGIVPAAESFTYMFTDSQIDNIAIVGDTANPVYTKEITITNTSDAANFGDVLNVYGVELWDAEGNAISKDSTQGGDLLFAFDFDAENDDIVTIAPGASHTFTAYYYPTASSLNNGQDMNIAHVDFITDAAALRTTSEWQAQSIIQSSLLVGDGDITCIDYLLTLNPTITNDGDDELVVSDIVMFPENDHYTIMSRTSFTLQPGETETLDIEYINPNSSPNDLVELEFITNFSDKHENGIAHNLPRLTLTMETKKYNRTTHSEIDGEIFSDPNTDAYQISFEQSPTGGNANEFEYTILLDSDDDDEYMEYLTDATLDDFTIEIMYDRNLLGPRNFDAETKSVVVDLGDDLEDFGTFEIVSAIEKDTVAYDDEGNELFNTMMIIEITNNATTPIQTEGEVEMLKVDFIVSLNDNLIDTKLVKIDHLVKQQDVCLETPTDRIAYLESKAVCAENIRLIEIRSDNAQFALNPVYPAPVSSAGADINFTLGFDCSTTITIYDAEGKTLAQPVNGFQTGGNHTVRVPVDKLSSGTYFIEMSAGPFRSTEQIVIEK
ncbi:MAG: hypothetical protein B7C24_11385, partial [Bacteroidetes bacterium 4572_77]